MTLKRVDLGDRGLEYVLEHLRGVNRLCEGLAEAVAAGQGQVFTLVPTGVDESAVFNLTSGGLLAENRDFSRAIPLADGQGSLTPVASLLETRARMTLEALNAHPGAICICDDFNPRWSDQTARENPFAFGVSSETYHLLTARNDVAEVTLVLGACDTVWHGVAAVCLTGLSPLPGRETSPNALAACAASVVELSCTAYDREGFVVWRRSL